MKRFILFSTAVLSLTISAGSVNAAGDVLHPKQVDWHFDGFTGSFDRPSIQRGLQVYKEVCATCHGLKRIAFRNLQDAGFSEEEVKTMAASYQIQDGPNDSGDMFERPGRPSDYFPSPFANEKAARAANGGAYPLDLSLVTKARADGPNYIFSLLTGYKEAPADIAIGEGMYYNPYFPGGQIAMPAPLSDGQVTYQDGTTATVEQMSKDVVNFLQWAAEPEMESRKRIGIKAMMYMLAFTILFYIAKKRIWARIKD